MTTQNMQVFNFSPDQRPVRVAMVNGEPWFVAQDVTEVLGIDRTQTRKLDEDEKGVRKIHTPGGIQEMAIINESGLYNLIFRSNKSEARVFRKWVTSEVLPAIRRTGRYQPQVRYTPESNAELGRTFQNIAYRELMNVESTRVRKRLAGIIDFYVSQIID